MSRRPEQRIAVTAAGNVRVGESVLTSAADGERLVQQGGIDALREVLARMTCDTAWIHFWRGYAYQFEDLALARAEWLLAETWFESDGDAQGLELCACGLAQCILLDGLSLGGFDARAGRVRAAAAGGAQPLALFRTAARLLLATQRHESTDAFEEHIEQAFDVLGTTVEPEIALRAAAAALPLLGQARDRVRSSDFIEAGTLLAASPRVSDYGRVLWHLCVVEARVDDPTWHARLHLELDAIDTLTLSDSLRSLRARAHLFRAALALDAGDTGAGGALLDTVHPLLDPSRPRDYWKFHDYRSRHALMIGDAQAAWEHAKACHRRHVEACVPESGRTAILMQEGFVLVARGCIGEATATFARAGALSRGTQAAPCFAHVHFARALQCWRGGDLGEARDELTTACAQARDTELTHFFPTLPEVAAELCGAALQLDVDPTFAVKVITARKLACPDVGIACWPWALRVRTLGGLSIERDGQTVRFARKAPKRLLDLIRLLVVLGGRQADTGHVAATLWPQAEGDEAREALKATLHRARALLGTDILVVRDRQIGFDERVAWLDTWAFEHVVGRIASQLGAGFAARHVDDGELERRRLQLFALYRGHLFGEAEPPPWALPLRDRSRARFIRTVDTLGQRLESTGRMESAVWIATIILSGCTIFMMAGGEESKAA